MTELLPQIKGNATSESLRPYMAMHLRKGAFQRLSPKGVSLPVDAEEVWRKRWKNRINLVRKWLPRHRERDSLFILLREWAAAELTPESYDEHWIVGERVKRKQQMHVVHVTRSHDGQEKVEGRRVGTLVFKQRITRVPQYRHRLSAAAREFVALAAYGYTVGELVRLARMGDQVSLYKLVALDKTFITAAFAQKWIRIAAAKEDDAFFKGLAKAVRSDTYRDHKPSARLAIAAYLAWFLGFERLPHSALETFLAVEDLVRYGSPDSISVLLSRLGLRKRRANPPNKKRLDSR